MRRSGYASDNGVFYNLQDQLKSTSSVVNQNGTLNGTPNYFYPYGGKRSVTFSALTTKRFTGQYHEAGLSGGEGLSYYNARWYDAQLGRFTSADTLVPDPNDPQDLNRFTYAKNSPLRYNDPSGHCATCKAIYASDGPPPPQYQSTLGSQTQQLNIVKAASAKYGVPWQITAGVLEAEIRLDTSWWDYVETHAIMIVPFAAWARSDPGPGIGNIHVSTAKSVSRYIATQYARDPDIPQLGYHDNPKFMVSWALTQEETNIWTATAIVRQLADYRFGSNRQPSTIDHSDLTKWTTADAVAVWHGYRYGVPDVSPGGSGFESLTTFQDRSPRLYQPGVFIGLGEPDKSAYGSIPSFLHYLQKK
jgi:RHS repeat-associated protein